MLEQVTPAPRRPRRAVTAGARGVLTGVLLAAVLGTTAPRAGHACACGCGVFEVGSQSMYPAHAGGMVSLEYDFMHQDRNWSGTAGAPAAKNADRQIRTSYATGGMQYLFDRSWGVALEVPFASRDFRTTADDGSTVASTHGALGDVRVQGVFTGFAADMSTGVAAGIKLPSGDSRFPGFDADTEIGSGSTDVLLGAWHVGALTADGAWRWFADVRTQLPVTWRASYHPGDEANATVAVLRSGWRLGAAKLAPRLQLIGSYRDHDRGEAANPGDSGYRRVLVAPAIGLAAGGTSVDVQLALPVYENVRGNQLVAPALLKLHASRGF